jgi:hypothetical protein
MERYGLEPLWATMDFPQEVQLGAALVLSRKRHALADAHRRPSREWSR